MECKVSNLSSNDLLISYASSFDASDSTINLNVQQTKIIALQGVSLSLKKSDGKYCTFKFHQIHATTKDSTKTLVKDFNKNNWILEKNKDKNVAICILEIHDGDLQ